MFDAIIIGGSYAGLSAAMQLARARRNICVVDAGLPRNRFASSSHGFFGQDGATPAAMISGARDQLLAYPTVSFVEETAVSTQQGDRHFVVELASGEELAGQRLLLAHGVTDRLPEIAGLADRWGQSVLHCPYCHGYEFAGQRLGVLYSMPGSLHQALLIPDWGPTTLFMNGAELPDAETMKQLEARGVIVEPDRILALEGECPSIDNVRLHDDRYIPLDALYIAPTTHICPLAGQLGCEVEDGLTGPFIRTDEMKCTSVPGVYAAGDAVLPVGNATVASASGVIAGSAVHQSLIFAAQ